MESSTTRRNYWAQETCPNWAYRPVYQPIYRGEDTATARKPSTGHATHQTSPDPPDTTPTTTG